MLVVISLGLSSRDLERLASWRALFRFFACIGTMNCPADVAQASSPNAARISPFRPFPSAPFPENEQSLLISAATAQRFEERTMRTGYPLPDPDTEVILRTGSVRLGDRVL